MNGINNANRQDGVTKKAYHSIGELVAEAKNREKRAAIAPEKKEAPNITDKKKGLEFMAMRFNIAEKHLELAVTKKITQAEDNLLKVIELGTIGDITSKKEFFLDDLSEKLGYKTPMKIWKLVKSLETKKLITREKTKSKGREIIGLNPEFFDQVLIQKYHEMDKRKHLKLAVDNSKNDVDNFEGDVDNFQDLQTVRL
jgi:hypothetical protein